MSEKNYLKSPELVNIVNMLIYNARDQFIILLKYCQKYASNFLKQAYDIRKRKIYTCT